MPMRFLPKWYAVPRSLQSIKAGVIFVAHYSNYKQQAGDLMKKVLLTGTTGTVAHVMRQELGDEYDISGISIARMDEILERDQPIVGKSN